MSDPAEGAAIGPLDIRRVMAALPHRYPMLLVDRVERLERDESITAIKAVSMNEGFFQGHFPGRPIMPGVLIVEALAQAAGILAVESLGLADSGKLVYFMAIEGAKFRLPVEPGCLLTARRRIRPEARVGVQVHRPRQRRRQACRRSQLHGDDCRSAGLIVQPPGAAVIRNICSKRSLAIRSAGASSICTLPPAMSRARSKRASWWRS